MGRECVRAGVSKRECVRVKQSVKCIKNLDLLAPSEVK